MWKALNWVTRVFILLPHELQKHKAEYYDHSSKLMDTPHLTREVIWLQPYNAARTQQGLLHVSLLLYLTCIAEAIVHPDQTAKNEGGVREI